MKKASNPLPVGKNDDLRLEITAFSALGTGIGRYQGFTVFVEGAVPGDVIDAHIIKVKPTYAVGIIRRVIKPSKRPDRAGLRRF
jgi:SAM-dependent methyltransferases related to tRNA (uracil-5-)-methyltransferase